MNPSGTRAIPRVAGALLLGAAFSMAAAHDCSQSLADGEMTTVQGQVEVPRQGPHSLKRLVLSEAACVNGHRVGILPLAHGDDLPIGETVWITGTLYGSNGSPRTDEALWVTSWDRPAASNDSGPAPESREAQSSLTSGFAILAVLGAIYFLPSIIAAGRHHRNSAALFALNLLLGWTLIGWVAALVWALLNGPSGKVDATPRMKRCPFCAELIQPAAVICKHCGTPMNAPGTVVVQAERLK